MRIEIVDISGTAYSRGKEFGAVRRRHIQACMSDWLNSLRTAGIGDPQGYIAEMLRETDFLTAVRVYAHDLLDEVEGITAGADLPLDLLLASQFMDEEWAYRASFQPQAGALQKCSSVAIRSRQGTTWVGQNMDLGGYTDGHQLLLRVSSGTAEPGALIFTIGGMIGLMGVNGSGVGVCVNSLPQLPCKREGLPVAFVVRKLLQQNSAAKAVEAANALPHATGQHYLIADRSSIRSIEASAVEVIEYKSPDSTKVLHTNHPLARDQQGSGCAQNLVNTVARLRSLTDRLMKGDPDLASIKEALSSSDDPEHPVCRLPDANGRVSPFTGMIGFTTGSMISELQEQSQTIDSWVSAGPPSVRGYTRIGLPG